MKIGLSYLLRAIRWVPLIELEQARNEAAQALAAEQQAARDRDASLAKHEQALKEQNELLGATIAERDQALDAVAARNRLLAEKSAQIEVIERRLRKENLLLEPNSDVLDYRERDFVVVLAMGRSGSTLLQGVLNTFPNFLIRGENNLFIAHLYRTYNDLVIARNFASTATTPAHPWFGCEELDAEMFILDCARIIARQLVGHRGGRKFDAIGFKEIRWSFSEITGSAPWHFLQFIEQVFPRAKFILLTRDVDEIMQSGWWPSVSSAATVSQVNSFYFLTRHAPVRHLFELDYRDLKPGTTKLRELAEFLGQTYSDKIDQVLQEQHSYDTTESNLREQEIKTLRALVDQLKSELAGNKA